jgi:hypothetical protein
LALLEVRALDPDTAPDPARAKLPASYPVPDSSCRRGNIRAVSAEHEIQVLQAGELVAALEHAWGAIRAHHDEVPPVVLVFGTGSRRRAARRKLGHFAPARWCPVHDREPVELPASRQAVDDGDWMAELAASAERLVLSARLLSWEAAASLSEVFITADGLAGSATEVLGTLVHEASHAIAFQRGIKDTSRQGRYHNKRFKALAEEVGLEVCRDPEMGWTATALSDAAAVAYSDTLAQLARALRVADEAELHSTPLDRKASRRGVGLLCECGPRLRTGHTVFTARGAICSVGSSGVMTLPPA